MNNKGCEVSFTEWLKGQQKRDDKIGDLSRDSTHDEGWPITGAKEVYLDHLKKREACADAIAAFEEAWLEYKLTLQMGFYSDRERVIYRIGFNRGLETGRESAIFSTMHFMESRQVLDLPLDDFKVSIGLPDWFIEWLDRWGHKK